LRARASKGQIFKKLQGIDTRYDKDRLVGSFEEEKNGMVKEGLSLSSRFTF
jgi:hypothetical protein